MICGFIFVLLTFTICPFLIKSTVLVITFLTNLIVCYICLFQCNFDYLLIDLDKIYHHYQNSKSTSVQKHLTWYF